MVAVFPVSFDKPAWLLLLAVIPLLVVASYRSLSGLERGRRICALVTRSLVIAAIVLALAHVAYQKENDRLTVIFLLDRSRSIPADNPDLLWEQENYIANLVKFHKGKQFGPDDKIAVISFSGEANLEQLPMKGGIWHHRIPPPLTPDVTDISQAFRLALASFPEDTAKRIVVLTDGNENAGDVAQEVAIANANGVSVDVAPMRYAHRAEVFFDRLIVPTHAHAQEQVPIRMILRSDHRAKGKIFLTHNGRPVPLGDDRFELGMPVEINPGVTPLQMKLRLDAAGPHRFEARFEPDRKEDDQVLENNRANGFTIVEGKGQVLLLTSNPDDDAPILDALQRERIDVVMHQAGEVTIDALELQQYGSIILANVPADRFTQEQQEVFASYVRDFGGGLIMTGGNEGFGAGGWIGSPVEEVMPVNFEIKHKKQILRGALVIIIDPAELGRANYWGEQVAIASLKSISSMDYFGCIANSWRASGLSWDVPLKVVGSKAKIEQQIKKMQVGDTQLMEPPLRLAVDGLKELQGRAAQKHIVIISDGGPSPENLQPLFKEMKDHKITCSTVAIGFGVHVYEAPLQQIAKAGEGKYYPVRNPKTLPQIFTKEAKIVTKPLISEEPFTPQIAYAFSPLIMGLSEQEGSLPQLGGFVMTQRKPSPQVEMPLVRLGEDGPDPLLAHWQYELGKAVAFTSGYWPRWGQSWVAWEQYSKLWAQIVRWSMRQNKASEFQVFTRLDGDQGRVVIEALNKDASYLNFLQMQYGKVIGPGSTAQRLDLVQTGPGRYEAAFDAREKGQYLVSMRMTEPGETEPTFISTGLSIPYSPEYRELSTNQPLLAQIVENNEDGQELTMNPEIDEVFRRLKTPTIARQPIWFEMVAWVLLPLFLLDVAGRRLASIVALSVFIELLILVVLLFGVGTIRSGVFGILGTLLFAEAVGWTIRFRSIEPTLKWLTHSVSALGRTGERSTVALSQLKEARDKVRDTKTAAGSVPRSTVKAPTVAAEPAPNRASRFDVGDKKAAETATADINEALGGATADPDRIEKAVRRRPAASVAEKPESGEGLTSRLLQAKKRAQQDIEDRNKED